MDKINFMGKNYLMTITITAVIIPLIILWYKAHTRGISIRQAWDTTSLATIISYVLGGIMFVNILMWPSYYYPNK